MLSYINCSKLYANVRSSHVGKKLKVRLILCGIVLSVLNSVSAEIPVIFIHVGKSDYLNYSLRQAKRNNRWVVCISDVNYAVEGVEQARISDYSESVNEFDAVYKHFSVNKFWIERVCLARWFILCEFMKKRRIDRCFYCDSDVMLYCDVTKKFDDYHNCDMAMARYNVERLSSVDGVLCSGGICYCSLKVLVHLCTYMIDFYRYRVDFLREKFEQRVVYADAVSDMSFITWFMHDFSKIYSFDFLTAELNGEQFDTHMHYDENGTYEMEKFDKRSIKKIVWIKDCPYCFNTKLKKMVKFCALHFHGQSRSLLTSFLKLSSVVK